MNIIKPEVADTKEQNSIDERCAACFLRTYKHLFEKFNMSISEQDAFLSYCKKTIIRNKHLSTPEIQKILNNKFGRIIRNSNPFEKEIEESNRKAYKLYQKWKPKVLTSSDPFDLALRLSIAGNIMDYGANNSFDITKTINSVLKSSFAIDHSDLLKSKIKESNKILYLGDNAGEIVFDKLFIETFMPNEIFYAVKSSPVLNDVTKSMAHETEMDTVADVISNGFNAPSTVLNKCSKKFLRIYHSADLIISKGQGNFEGLMSQRDSRIFFLLMVKCDVIAEKLNVSKGSFIVLNQSK